MDHGASHAMLMTMVLAIAVGVLLLAVGRRIGVPGIVLLLVGGVALGPMGAGVIQPDSLGDGLRVIVSFSIGLILFEGGLTLDPEGFRSAGSLIRRLLSLGVAVTWMGTAAAIHLLYGQPIDYSVIAASLVIVTGPTVIGPLLKRIRVKERLDAILHWEGVLIDPIGVFIALFCFEWIGQANGQSAVLTFGARVAAGLGLGVVGGFVIYEVVRRNWIPEEMLDAGALGLAILLFGATEALASEAGLLSMTVAGFLVGLKRPEQLKQLRAFKAQVTDLAIGTLFMLLTARLGFEQFRTFGFEGLAVVAVVMFVVRPLSIAACAIGLDYDWRERLFLSWIAPRGIVAATMASLVSLALESTGRVDDPKFVETFTYSVIIATIVIQGATASPLVKLLRLRRARPTGWLIVGAHALARGVARFLGQEAGRTVALIDTNAQAVREAAAEGFTAIRGDARDVTIVDRQPELRAIGNLLALTDNDAMNVLVCQRWADVVGRGGVFRWAPADEAATSRGAGPGTVVWASLPKPSLLSAELAAGDAWLVWGHAPDAGVSSGSRPLLVADDEGVALVAGSGPRVGAAEDEVLLCLRRRADYLLRAVLPELIVRLVAADRETVLTELVGRVAELVPEISRADLVSELVDREETFPSALGGGVAVPHAYSRAVTARICAVGLLEEGVDMRAPDDLPVRLVFLLLSPWGDPEGHLSTLAEIARLVVDPDVRARLIAAATPLGVIEAIQDAQRR